MNRSCLFRPTLVLIAPFACAPSFAQISSASVSGVVEDASGGRLSRSSISLVNLLDGTITTARTTADGSFLVSSLVPGNYSLQVACDGFATLRLVGLTLNIGQSRQFRVRLAVHSAEQSIDVLAGRLASASEGAEVSTVVPQQLVSNLPLAGKSFQDLVAMTPGLVLGTPQGALPGEFSVNGQPIDTNTYLVDGVSANFSTGPLQADIKVPAAGQYAALTTLGTTQGILSLDALQEFRVVTSTANPEYGRGVGGFFALLSRQGDQVIHGSAYASVRNSFPDAGEWFTQSHSYYHQQDIGVSLSGPLLPWKRRGSEDRTFFFGAYEELHVEQRPAALNQYVPSQALIEQVPTSVRSALGALPEGYDPVGASLVRDYLYDSGVNPPSFLRSQEYRLDRGVHERIHFFAHYGDHPSHSEAHNLYTDSIVRSSIRSLTFGMNQQISVDRANELRGNIASDSTSLSSRNTASDFENQVAQPHDIAASFGLPSTNTQAEIFLRSAGSGQSFAQSDTAEGKVRQFELRDVFSYQRGSHLIRIGVDFREIHSDLLPSELTIQANYLTLHALLSNRATAAVFRRSVAAHSIFRQAGIFGQDSWRVSPRLSVSLGLRWDISPAPSAADGRLPLTFTSAGLTDGVALRDINQSLWSTDWTNLGPRVGTAWTAVNHSGRELVVHAGVGMLYGSAHQAAAGLFSGLGFVASDVVAYAALPYSPAYPSIPSGGAADIQSGLGYLVPKTLRSPWNLEWNASIEQALGPGQILTVAAVGASGPSRILTQRHLITSSELPIKAYASFAKATSNYNSLQLQWRGTSRGQITWTAAYTLGHALDHDSVDPYQSLSYGAAATDVRHNLQTSFAWSIPTLVKRNLVTRAATQGWGVDGRWFLRSAYPVSPIGEFRIDPVTGERLPTNVDWFRAQPLYVADAAPGGRRINGGPANPFGAFRVPANGTTGNAPRNVARGSSAQELSLSLRRDVHLYSKLILQIRGDLFNVTNSPDFGYVDPQLGDRLFGQAVLSLNQSYGQTGSLYQPGGPRTIQWNFRLKW